MKTLTVLYDAQCDICRFSRRWLEQQPKHVEMAYVPAGSREARSLFPTLDHAATLGELTVIADDGALWRGHAAWLTCLWAVQSTRGWSLALARDGRVELARRAFDALSRNRDSLRPIASILEAVS